jgi:dipeptidyl aminopeptidase/acylaminoacyl peptidase
MLERGQQEPRRVTDTNPWLADVPMGEQRVVRYGARDGAYEIEGLLILPVGYAEGTRVPLITVVHGGPEAHYSNGWITAYQLPGQMAAARGYAVFYPNYRGSTGRGLDFVMSSQADAGGREFDDIVDGVDHLIAMGIADGDRVGVTGGSYGGYATAWMSTYYSERFAAGVMSVGISNNLSKWGTSDIPNELYLVHSREWMWEDDNWMKYLQRSPIYHVDRAQTPLLILHGAEDTRVHPGQSLELYRHMVVRRPEVPVRLILYPGEGHGNVRSASRLDYTLRMMGWFDAYLQGDGTMPSRDLDRPAATAGSLPATGMP